ncbi:MAG: hypothetical protein N2746_02415, partial [Deltaproteobacteria bacterium]|nr:hypothetical protein [Deltaproteobacteria bacterium]
KGKRIIREIKEFENWFYQAIDIFPQNHKSFVFTFLIELLKILKQEGNLEVLRSCILCENFEAFRFKGKDKPHFCRLLNLSMDNDQIQIDCTSNRPSDSNLKSREPVLIKNGGDFIS